MQGVVQEYDPAAQTGVVVGEPDRVAVYLRPGSLGDGIFRALHAGQRIVFEVEEEEGRHYAARVRIGMEVFLQLPEGRQEWTGNLLERLRDEFGEVEIAIEEGSTMVRIGTSIFGERNFP